MAITLQSLRKVRADQPPRILIYGPEKMGKTTLASEFPAPVFLQTERGESAGLEIDSFGQISSFPEVLEALGALYTEEHKFQTVVVDSMSALERLIWISVCATNNWASIESPGFGKGYVEADLAWSDFFEALEKLREGIGMNIVLIAHSAISRFDDPETQSYNRYDIDLHKRAEAVIKREVDAILLLKKDVTIKLDGTKSQIKDGTARARGDGGDARWIYCQGRPAFTAGNRYAMPDKVLFERGKGYAALAPYLPAQPEPEASAKAAGSKKAA
jgi:hypothetical protein